MAAGDTERNRAAWNAGRYEARVKADGAPADLAREIVADPRYPPRRLLTHLGAVAGMRICNLQGSRGKIAVALALLGADVTVIDFAEENRRYALALAAAADVAIDYRLADSMEADTLGLGQFDIVLMEFGVLHYHQDIARFFAVVAALTKPGGRMLLNEFHPVRRKLFLAMGDAPPDHFRTDIVIDEVPNPDSSGPSLGICAYRFWTLSEVFAAALGAGFEILTFAEYPDWDELTQPGTDAMLARLKP